MRWSIRILAWAFAGVAVYMLLWLHESFLVFAAFMVPTLVLGAVDTAIAQEWIGGPPERVPPGARMICGMFTGFFAGLSTLGLYVWYFENESILWFLIFVAPFLTLFIILAVMPRAQRGPRSLRLYPQ